LSNFHTIPDIIVLIYIPAIVHGSGTSLSSHPHQHSLFFIIFVIAKEWNLKLFQFSVIKQKEDSFIHRINTVFIILIKLSSFYSMNKTIIHWKTEDNLNKWRSMPSSWTRR
jgi:hypothetical protein